MKKMTTMSLLSNWLNEGYSSIHATFINKLKGITVKSVIQIGITKIANHEKHDLRFLMF